FSFRRQPFARPLGERGSLEETDVRNGIFTPGSGGVKTGKISNQPLAVVQFPVKRRLPMFAFDSFPAFRKPPAKVLIAAVAHEFEKLAIGDQCAIDREVWYEDAMRRLLVIESKTAAFMAEAKHAAFDLSHAFHFRV